MDLASIRIVASAKQLALSPKQSRSRHPTIRIIPKHTRRDSLKDTRKDTKMVLQLDWHKIKLEAVVVVVVVGEGEGEGEAVEGAQEGEKADGVKKH